MDTGFPVAIWTLMVRHGAACHNADDPIDFYSGKVDVDRDATIEVADALGRDVGLDLARCTDPTADVWPSFTDTYSPPDQVHALSGTLALQDGRTFPWATVLPVDVGIGGLLRLLPGMGTLDEAAAYLADRLERASNEDRPVAWEISWSARVPLVASTAGARLLEATA